MSFKLKSYKIPTWHKKCILPFTPLESPAACSGDEDIIPFRPNTGFNAPLALLETFSNGVNEPPRWKVEDFLTGFTPSPIPFTLNDLGGFF